MKGRITKATSNASYKGVSPSVGSKQAGKSGTKQQSAAISGNLCSIHTWRNDSRGHETEIGAFEMKFEKPTSLVSLNIDLTFECSDSRKLLHCLQPDIQNAIQSQTSVDSSSKEETKATEKTDDATPSESMIDTSTPTLSAKEG